MRISKVLLISGSLLALDLSLFQAHISFVSEWSAALGAPQQLVSNPRLLLIAGILMSMLMVVSGLYGLSGAGILRRLPLLRLGLLTIGLGYVMMGLPLFPQLLVLTHVVSMNQPILIEAVACSTIALIAGLLYLAGLVSGWRRVLSTDADQIAARARDYRQSKCA